MKKITVVLWSDEEGFETSIQERLEDDPSICVISATEKEVEDFWLDPDWTARANSMLCGDDYRTAPIRDEEPDDPPPDTEKSDGQSG